MRLVTTLGTYTIVQAQPPDDGDAAVYHVQSASRQPLETLRQTTGLTREILPPPSTGGEHCLIITRNEIFDILSALAETIDYPSFDEKRPST